MEKFTEEFLNFLNERNALEKFTYNFNNRCGAFLSDDQYVDEKWFVSDAFSWSSTPEGGYFWLCVSSDWVILVMTNKVEH